MDVKWVNIIIVFLVIVCSKPTLAHEFSETEEKKIELTMRMIGHRILLNADDSLSRVLPIEKMGERYLIQFESDFYFNPEELVNTIHEIVAETAIASSYFVEVLKCNTDEVIYSFQDGLSKNVEIVPCGIRPQLKECYKLLFTIVAKSLPEEEYETAPLLKIVGVLFPVVIILIVLFTIWKRRKGKKVHSHIISIGKFLFDTRKSTLKMEHQLIELTSKEADLLLLLNQAVNETVGREVILKHVWGDEGDYVGRTLDVFISKLRKKLEDDAQIQIVNVRGVGYKLIVDH